MISKMVESSKPKAERTSRSPSKEEKLLLLTLAGVVPSVIGLTLCIII